MRDYIIKFWSSLFVLLFTFLLAGCDVEYLEYDDDDTYALFDRPDMAPASPEEIARALQVIELGAPLNEIPWAYSIMLDFLGVTVDPDDISYALFTVEEVGNMLSDVGVTLAPWFPHVNFVDEVLRMSITEFNKPGFDPQNPPKNAALAALALSLASGSMERPRITRPDQVNMGTLLTHGDVLLLLVSIYQSQRTVRENNALAETVDEVLEESNSGMSGVPDIIPFLRETVDTQASTRHQGELIIG